uniref:CUB-like domain-containing protein n=2 Tax=Caenorhabditis japonica TaxID=281687 RepID=A0A8R1DTY3_CAEJA
MYYAPAKYASLTIRTGTNLSMFWFKYKYVSVQGLENVKLPSGTPVALNLTSSKTYTFTSAKNDSLVLNSGSAIYPLDPYTKQVFVYDGPDTNSPYLGTVLSFELDQALRNKSSGSTLTLLNVYNETSYSYAMVNDYSDILKYTSYSFFAFSQKYPFDNALNALSGPINGVTFFCVDCQEAYISSLNLLHYPEKDSSIQLQPLTPAQNQPVYLTYSSKDFSNQSLPQLIPGNLFTLSTDANYFAIRLESNDLVRNAWKKPFYGKKGTIFSPSLWTPGANSSFDQRFESSQSVKFTFNVPSLVINQKGEELRVQIGSSGANSFNTVFNETLSNPGTRVANGTYLEATFSGTSSKSSTIVTFEMKDPNESTITTTIKSTTDFSPRGFDSIIIVLPLFFAFFG